MKRSISSSSPSLKNEVDIEILEEPISPMASSYLLPNNSPTIEISSRTATITTLDFNSVEPRTKATLNFNSTEQEERKGDDFQIPFISPDFQRKSSIHHLLDSSGKFRKSIGIDINTIMTNRHLFENSGTRSKSMVQQHHKALNLEEWEYPGWGDVTEKFIDKMDLGELKSKHQLNLIKSVAIAGNDLFASVLYTTGLVCTACGQLAPIAMLICCIALYPFRNIFKECGTALPLNGGVYIALLNSSSKFIATFAASCSLISYSATAVVSAASCTSYAQSAFGYFPVTLVTIAILGGFALIVLFGVKDSANVAVGIFTFHLLTLAILVITCFIFIFNDGGNIFLLNTKSTLPISTFGIPYDLLMGFSVSLLGLTGFETSANYIEEAGPFETESNKKGEMRKESIFEKTINSMWILVIVINPIIAIVTLGVVDLPTITLNVNTILSLVGSRAGGFWLQTLVSIDAILVLAGGVLTAFVGVTGLVKQLAADRCFPAFLMSQNKTFGTNHWTILFFFLLCSALYIMTNGDVTILSGVFSIAFLMVLIMFAIANMFLKYNRPRLPRGASIGWNGVLIGLISMLVGLIGNIIYNPSLVKYFIIYLIFYFSVILIYYQRVRITNMFLYFVKKNKFLDAHFTPKLIDLLIQMKQFTVLFFSNTSELHVLNKAILYARDNEQMSHLIICHICSNRNSSIPESLKHNLTVLDHIYPKIKIDLLIIETEASFCPQLVLELSNQLGIPPSFMFIRCPGKNSYYHIGDYNGVRSIMK